MEKLVFSKKVAHPISKFDILILYTRHVVKIFTSFSSVGLAIRRFTQTSCDLGHEHRMSSENTVPTGCWAVLGWVSLRVMRQVLCPQVSGISLG